MSDNPNEYPPLDRSMLLTPRLRRHFGPTLGEPTITFHADGSVTIFGEGPTVHLMKEQADAFLEVPPSSNTSDG